MNLEETKVRLTGGAKARIIALVGEQRMAAFIREAVDAAIVQAEKERRKKSASSNVDDEKKPRQ